METPKHYMASGKGITKNRIRQQFYELSIYILNNFIGVINDEILGSNYDENYFLWLSEINQLRRPVPTKNDKNKMDISR
jgi:hypothetical protein